ncbi:MAG TPA: hypothetical protein VFG68_00185 [Fimbriiglobus sp.]|nr:hypothetical protein [Fimbriiglobus sp.]
MGVYLHYQAMPDDSRLARRLRTNRPLCAMYCELIHSPAGPWDPDRLPLDDFDEALADIANNPEFGSLPAAVQAYDDLRAELERAEREYPGLRRRAAYFKLIDFDAQLARGLVAAGCPDAERLAGVMVWGAGQFAPDGFGGRNVTLQHIPPPLVADAAKQLRGVEPGAFEWRADDWESFRGVYAEAAARNEGVVIA